MVSGWIFWAVTGSVCIGALVALGSSRMPALLKVLFWLGGIGLIGWSIVGRQVIIIDVEDEEVTYTYRYRVPFLPASISVDGQPVSIVNEAQYAVINLSADTMIISRTGGTWPFGLLTIESLVIELPPGEVAQLPAQIRHVRNRGASYFSVLRKRVPDTAGEFALDLLDQNARAGDFELVWPEVYLHKKRLIEWLGQESVAKAVHAQLGGLSSAPFEDVYIAYEPESQTILWGFQYVGESAVSSALLVFNLDFQWVETRSSARRFFDFESDSLSQKTHATYPKLIFLYRDFSGGSTP